MAEIEIKKRLESTETEDLPVPPQKLGYHATAEDVRAYKDACLKWEEELRAYHDNHLGKLTEEQADRYMKLYSGIDAFYAEKCLAELGNEQFNSKGEFLNFSFPKNDRRLLVGKELQPVKMTFNENTPDATGEPSSSRGNILTAAADKSFSGEGRQKPAPASSPGNQPGRTPGGHTPG
jgi:hypothetical protein